MTALLVLIFAAVALLAIGFAAWPVLFNGSRGMGGRKARAMLAGAIALLMLGIGGGTYWMLGSPELAQRTLEGTNARDLNGLIGLLARRVRAEPGNIAGWTLLGRAYLGAGDPADAAKAFARALALGPSPDLYSAYGEALVAQSSGSMSAGAEAAFRSALAGNPKDEAARYYIGQADAERGQTDKARAIWQGLLADLPPASPQHEMLVDRLAALGGGAAPDISAMIAGLAARLKTAPDDPPGWQRLVRAYAVLGDTAKARAALAEARAALAKQPDALSALGTEAKSLKLE